MASVVDEATTTLAMQRFMRAHTLEAAREMLERQYGIRMSRAGALVGFKYTPHSPMAHPLVREARGLILDSSDGWAVVARPFLKFFNLGEDHPAARADAAVFDWATARAFEKIDGTLIVLAFVRSDARWHVATTGSVDASGVVMSSVAAAHNASDAGPAAAPGAVTFAELFWATFRSCGHALPVAASEPEPEPGPGHDALAFTFMLELCHPASQIVVAHPEPRVVLLGAVHRDTGAELLPADAAALWARHAPVTATALPTPAQFVHARDTTALDAAALRASFADRSPLAFEGYVVVDAAWRRLKLKHPGYVAAHAMGGRADTRTLVTLVRTGASAEFVAYHPQWADALAPVDAAYAALVADIEADWAGARELGAKAFARAASESRAPDALAALRAGVACSAHDFLDALELKPLMALLGVDDTRRAKSGLKGAAAKRARRAAAAAAAAATATATATAIAGKAQPVVTATRAVAAADGTGPSGELAVLGSVRHGSLDSTDRDVIYFVTALPPARECHAFCAMAPAGEDRNVVVLASDGTVRACFKGLPDEVNNALLVTWALHAENATGGAVCPVRARVLRNVASKTFVALASVLGRVGHSLPARNATRALVKDALAARKLATRVAALAALGSAAALAQLDVDTRKGVAFQVGQVRALLGGHELYTKGAIAAAFPALAGALARAALDEHELTAMGAELGALAHTLDAFKCTPRPRERAATLGIADRALAVASAPALVAQLEAVGEGCVLTLDLHDSSVAVARAVEATRARAVGS